MHLPLCLWFIAGIAYTGGEWRNVSRTMDFLRFSGEVFIYTTLLFCGIFVISGLSMILFESIGIKAEKYVIEHFAVLVAAASPIIAAYLVDQKRSVVENFAPILARIFAPLLLGVMLVFLGVMAVLRKSPFLERDFLIGVRFLLILVLGIVFYIISTRKETTVPQVYDWISLFLIAVALIIDTIALSAIVFRLSASVSARTSWPPWEKTCFSSSIFWGWRFFSCSFSEGKYRSHSWRNGRRGFFRSMPCGWGLSGWYFPLIFSFK